MTLQKQHFLININKEKPENYLGAYEYFTGNTYRATDKEFFIGYLMAYEFTSKEFSVLTERKNAEKKSIAAIRNDFQKHLDNTENQLIEYLNQTKEKSDENSIAIENFRKEKEIEFYKWYDNTVASVNTFNNDSSQKIKDFEELYKEKLKLEAPAKYWSDRAQKLRTEGNKWLAGLIIAVLVGVGLLIWCLAEISAGTLDKIFQNNGTAIKWSVVLLRLFFYCIRNKNFLKAYF
ncbi:MAG: hypothetical protein IPP48_16785 [Chitinophagaceae bacterium]|nr:hypothetical protein [Chitinophagaceae bacterium]